MTSSIWGADAVTPKYIHDIHNKILIDYLLGNSIPDEYRAAFYKYLSRIRLTDTRALLVASLSHTANRIPASPAVLFQVTHNLFLLYNDIFKHRTTSNNSMTTSTTAHLLMAHSTLASLRQFPHLEEAMDDYTIHMRKW